MKITLPEFLALAHRLATEHKCSVTSWIRTPARNARVGGKPNSCHVSGFGIDLVPDNPSSKPALLQDAREAGLDAVDEGHHIHIEVDPPNQA
jgi:protoporphyrinogen oxidase